MMAQDKDLALADVPPVALADDFDLSGGSSPPWDGPSDPDDAVTTALAATIADALDPWPSSSSGHARDEATPASDVDLPVSGASTPAYRRVTVSNT